MRLMPSFPGSFGSGYWLKYSDSATFGPMPRGSRAAIWAGVRPYIPAGTVCVPWSPVTLSPGHSAGFSHGYTSTPSLNDPEGTSSAIGLSLCSESCS
jgi:hypothetical protein